MSLNGPMVNKLVGWGSKEIGRVYFCVVLQVNSEVRVIKVTAKDQSVILFFQYEKFAFYTRSASIPNILFQLPQLFEEHHRQTTDPYLYEEEQV